MNLMESIKNNLKEAETEAGNDLDEICSYVYDDCDGNMDNFPDKERMEYIADVNGREYNKIKKLVEKAIGNVADHLYSYDRWGKDNIELSDRATMNYIHGNFDNVDPEESMMTYEKLRDQAFKNFEDETGVEIFQDGRSGRHIVVENNYYNASHYDELCAAQEKWEDWLIDEVAKAYPETEEVNESQKLKEAEASNIVGELYNDFKDSPNKTERKIWDLINHDTFYIIKDGNVWWFEKVNSNKSIPNYCYDYLRKYIKKNYGLDYLYDVAPIGQRKMENWYNNKLKERDR